MGELGQDNLTTLSKQEFARKGGAGAGLRNWAQSISEVAALTQVPESVAGDLRDWHVAQGVEVPSCFNQEPL